MVDQIDQALIGLLTDNPRQSSIELGNKLGVDPSTIRRWIGKLVKEKVLAFSITPNPDILGFPVRAIIALNVTPGEVIPVIETLKSQQEIRWILPISGRFDIICYTWFKSNETILFFIENIVGKLKGVRSTEVFIILSKVDDIPTR
jgi:DNA-binding Lrp family transcriptional regulator